MTLNGGPADDPFDPFDTDDIYSLALSEGVSEDVIALADGMTPFEFRDYLIRLLAHVAEA
jgi:hypothetical protein